MPAQRKRKSAESRKYAKVIREFKHGTLHSGSKKGPVVRDFRQAKAIARSEALRAKRK